MIGKVVGVLVTLAVLQSLSPLVMGVAKVIGDRKRSAVTHIVQGSVDGTNGAVAFVGGGDVNGGLRQGDACLGPADKLCRLTGGLGEHQCHGIGQSHVLRRTNDHAAGNEPGVFTRMDHFGKPVEGGIHITSPHRLYKGRDGVVVRVAIGIIDDRLFLNALFGHGEIDMDTAIGSRGGGQDGDLKGIERLAGVSIRHGGQMPQGSLLSVDLDEAETTLTIT